MTSLDLGFFVSHLPDESMAPKTRQNTNSTSVYIETVLLVQILGSLSLTVSILYIQ